MVVGGLHLRPRGRSRSMALLLSVKGSCPRHLAAVSSIIESRFHIRFVASRGWAWRAFEADHQVGRGPTLTLKCDLRLGRKTITG